MSADLATVLAIFVLIVTAFGLLAFLQARHRAAQEEELRAAAASRGWRFEAATERGHRVHRWTGTTDGVAWRAESLRRLTGGQNKHRRRRHIGRWHGAWSPGIAAPIVFIGVPKGKELTGHQAPQGDGMFVRLAQQAAGFMFDQALDVYFGDDIGREVDARELHRVEDARVPGFIVSAADAGEARRVLAQGLERALTAATSDRASVLADDDRPYVLLRPNGISLARMEQFRDTPELERVVHAGVALTRAFTFGRPA